MSNRDLIALLALLVCLPVAAADTDPLDFSLGELVNQEVISVARKRQELADVAAAVHVVSAEDIARMGVTTLPDALRLVPGVQVAAIGANRWAVSVRGFNGRFANKLLVMVDGRTVYSPLFSGTFWEALDIPLAEVDRIEVIRGPGASIWGANAVNGIVNIITKWARATQGRAVELTTGDDDRALVYLRQGGVLDDGHYRLSYHGRTRDASRRLEGGDGDDSWRTHRLGLRLERFLGELGEFSLSGEAFRADSEDFWNLPDITEPDLVAGTRLNQRDLGAGLTARLNRVLDGGREWSLQGSLQSIDKSVGTVLSEQRTTLDLDAQYRFSRGRHDVIVGGGMRYSDQKVDGNGFFLVDQPRRRFGLVSAFLHDEYALRPDLTLTAGLKFEHHSWTGNELQPNLRLGWQPAPRHLLWAAVSEASRTPARVEFDMSYSPQAMAGLPPRLTRISNAESIAAERMRAYEIGYRGQPAETANVDVTAFLMDYRHLRTVGTPVVSFDGTWLVIDGPQAFSGDGTVSGIEASLDWQPSPAWRARFAYSHLETQVELSGNPIVDGASRFYMERVPSDQASAHLTWKPRAGHAVDLVLRHVGALLLDEQNAVEVDAYTELDLQYAWRISPALTVSATGRNLLDDRHVEFGRLYMPTPAREVGRSVHFTAQWALD